MFLQCPRRDASQSEHVPLTAKSPPRLIFGVFFRAHASHPGGRVSRPLWWQSIGGLVGKFRPTKPTNLSGWYCSPYWNRALPQKPLDTNSGLAGPRKSPRFPVLKTVLISRVIPRHVDLPIRTGRAPACCQVVLVGLEQSLALTCWDALRSIKFIFYEFSQPLSSHVLEVIVGQAQTLPSVCP